MDLLAITFIVLSFDQQIYRLETIEIVTFTSLVQVFLHSLFVKVEVIEITCLFLLLQHAFKVIFSEPEYNSSLSYLLSIR